MLDEVATKRVESVLRTLATALRSLRLYPATSPMPRQSVDAAHTALAEFFAANQPVLSLSLAREGFAIGAEAVGTQIPGARELSDELREHGVAELDIMPDVSADEILAFLSQASRPPEEVRADGGLAAICAAKGVESIRVTDVTLTVIDTSLAPEDEDIEAFLQQLASDPEKFGTWFAAAALGDPAGFADGLEEMMRATGAAGRSGMVQTLATAFVKQESDAKDVLLSLAMQPGNVRGLTSQMFSILGSTQIAGSVLEGRFGKNMLSLSSALTDLPLEQVTAQVRAEVQAMLPGSGHTTREADFLTHMLDVRAQTVPETSLVDADRTYQAVAQAAAVRDEDVARARTAVSGSGGALNAGSVRTMLVLLDQQNDFELYCSGIDSLAGMVPRLVEGGDLPLASRVVVELANRQARPVGPWPELSERVARALAVAAGSRTMGALLDRVIAEPASEPFAHDIVRSAGDAAGPALVAEAIARKSDGLRIAEELLGRRVIDLLNAVAPTVQWYQLGPVVERLAREGDSRSMATVETLMRRPDEQSRREVATALAAASGPAAGPLLAQALRDSSTEVAIIAARAIAKSGTPGSAARLGSRLDEIDVDNADFLFGRELIAALARMSDPGADAVLAKVASRRALIKRGHFAEVQALVAQAQQARAHGGARR